MITNVRRVKSSGDIQRYVRYTIAPEEEQNHKDYVFGERTLELESDYIDIGLDVERNRTSHEITDQIMQWNDEKRAGKKQPASPALAGVIAFSINDTDKLYTTTQHGVRYLDRKRAIQIARENLGETMGYDRPMFLSLHGDKDHLHVHFVVGIVDSQGKIWDGSTMTNDQGEKVKVRDYRQWEITNEKLEIKYGLERVSHRKAFEHEGEHRQAQIKRPSNAVVHLANKGEIAPSLDLAGRLDYAYSNCDKQFDKFLELSEQVGLTIKPNMGTTKVNGLSFSIDGMDIFIKASDLGNKYKWTKLAKDLNYEHERDFTKLAELKATASTDRPDIAASRTNQRITIIADNLNAATEAAKLGTNLQPEQQYPGTSYEPSQGPSRPKTTTGINDDQPRRNEPVIGQTQQDSWNNGNGLQQDGRPGRKGRGGRETSGNSRVSGLDDEHSINHHIDSGANVLLQEGSSPDGSAGSQTSNQPRHQTDSQTDYGRVATNQKKKKKVIDSLFNGDESDIKQVQEHIEESWSKRLNDAFAQMERRREESKVLSNDGPSI